MLDQKRQTTSRVYSVILFEFNLCSNMARVHHWPNVNSNSWTTLNWNIVETMQIWFASHYSQQIYGLPRTGDIQVLKKNDCWTVTCRKEDKRFLYVRLPGYPKRVLCLLKAFSIVQSLWVICGILPLDAVPSSSSSSRYLPLSWRQKCSVLYFDILLVLGVKQSLVNVCADVLEKTHPRVTKTI